MHQERLDVMIAADRPMEGSVAELQGEGGRVESVESAVLAEQHRKMAESGSGRGKAHN